MQEKVKEEQETQKPESSSLISTATAIAERLEAANKRTEELLNRQEELAAQGVLGGRAFAGDMKPKAKMSDAEYAESIRKGVVPNEE